MHAMRISLKPCGSVDHELIWGLIGLLAVTVAALLPVDEMLAAAGYRCGFHTVTGIPCPSCGATRAFVAAAHLHMGDAFRTNPLAAAFFLGLVGFVPYALATVLLRTRRVRVSGVGRRGKHVILALAGLIVLANWAYLIVALPPA